MKAGYLTKRGTAAMVTAVLVSCRMLIGFRDTRTAGHRNCWSSFP